jgi:hypothetical protein
LNSDTATQAGAALFLSVLLAGAVIILGQIDLPPGGLPFGPAGVTDSYGSIHLSIDPSNKLAASTGPQDQQQQRRAAADAAEFTTPDRAVAGTPRRLNPDAEPRHRTPPPAPAPHDPEAFKPQDDRGSPGGGSAGKPEAAPRAERRPPERSKARPQDDGGAVRRDTSGPARKVAAGKPLSRSGREGAARRTADSPQRAGVLAQRTATTAAAPAVHRDRKPVGRPSAAKGRPKR